MATNPTQRWAGARGIYVDVSDAAYIAWDAINGNDSTNIDTEAHLSDALHGTMLSVYQGGSGYSYAQALNQTSDVVLTNPMSEAYDISFTANGHTVTLPQMNLPNSRPEGVSFRIRNVSTSGYSFTLRDFTGAPITGVSSTILPGQSVTVTPKNGGLLTGGLFQADLSFVIDTHFSPVLTDTTLSGASDATLPTSLAVKTYIDAADATKQPLDSDLTTIAGLTATTDSFLQAKSSAWASRTIAQVKTDLGLSGTNSGDQTITLTGDVTGSGTGSFAATLATVNGNVGNFGSATQSVQYTVNGKGLITAAANVTITPAVGSITGFGTGVATALAANVGSAGAPVTFNGAGGTPSSLTLTNATGLPTAGLVDASVTLAKMANMATSSLIYRRTAATGVPEVNTLAQLKTDLALVKADVGLGSVDNVADASKPVSTAQAAADAAVLAAVGFHHSALMTVDFNSANTDNAITVPIPAGYSRWRVQLVQISNCSASITTATAGLFTSTGGGGTAIASTQALTVSTAAENTNNNCQGLTLNNSGTQSYTATTVYFRVTTAQGSAATGKVLLVFVPMS